MALQLTHPNSGMLVQLGPDSTRLRFVDTGRVAVTHRTQFYAELTFQIALHMEFSGDSVDPLTIQIERLRRVAEISAVDQVLHHLNSQQQFVSKLFAYDYLKP